MFATLALVIRVREKGESVDEMLSPPDLQPAPYVGFNLTFVCPEGEVFDHDWFATPFLITTCQPNGIFDAPDWATYRCVIREFHKNSDYSESA